MHASLRGFHGKPQGQIAVASIFTTQSATALLEQVRRQIKASTPAPANFVIGDGGVRTVFPLTDVTSVRFSMQTNTAPTFVLQPDLTPFLAGVGSIAFGTFDAPDYETASKVIPAVGARTGVAAVQGTNRLYFNLFLPPGTAPAGGWPVAIYGHGFTDNKNQTPVPRRRLDGPAGDRDDRDQRRRPRLRPARNPDRQPRRPVRPSCCLPADVASTRTETARSTTTEGVNAVAPQTLVGNRDGLRQTVIDLMSLVREIEVGVDVDGNGTRDLDPAKISYFGQSFGGIYGTKFLAVEPNVRAGVPNVPGGAIIEIARLSPSFRPLVWLSLVGRAPQLANLPGPLQFNENMPLRNLPPLIDTVPGASAIQQLIEWTEWTSQAGNPVAYAPHLRADPLEGVPAKSIILQFARGDQTVPNPTTSAIIRAGGSRTGRPSSGTTSRSPPTRRSRRTRTRS